MTPENADPRLNNARLNKQEISDGKLRLQSLPTTLSIGLTTRCNLACIMCSQSTMRGGQRFDMDDSLLNQLSPLLGIALEVRWNENGELFASPRIKEYLQLIKKSGVPRNVISTNLMGAERYLDTLATINISQLNISIDAARKSTYESIRKGAHWELLVQTLGKLRDLKQNTSFPRTVFTFIPMKMNLMELADFVVFASEYGADEIQFLKLAPAYVGWEQVPDPHEELEHLENACEMGQQLNITIKHTYFHDSELHPHRTPDKTGKPLFTPISPEPPAYEPYCHSPWQESVIEADGTVRPCCHMGTPFGNLNDQTFTEIWNNQQFIALRKAVLEHDYCLCSDCPTARKTAVTHTFNTLLNKTFHRLNALKNLDTDCHEPDPAKKSKMWGILSPARYAYNTSWNLSENMPDKPATGKDSNALLAACRKLALKLHKLLFPSLHADVRYLLDRQHYLVQTQTQFNARISEYLNMLSDQTDTFLHRQKRFNDTMITFLNLSLHYMNTTRQNLQIILETFSHALQSKFKQPVHFSAVSQLFYNYNYIYQNAPNTCEPAAPVELVIELTNQSLQPWPADEPFPVRIAYAWCSQENSIPEDAPRVNLPKCLSPGETTTITIYTTAPDTTGLAYLKWDPVREGIAWFHHMNNECPCLNITIQFLQG